MENCVEKCKFLSCVGIIPSNKYRILTENDAEYNTTSNEKIQLIEMKIEKNTPIQADLCEFQNNKVELNEISTKTSLLSIVQKNVNKMELCVNDDDDYDGNDNETSDNCSSDDVVEIIDNDEDEEEVENDSASTTSPSDASSVITANRKSTRESTKAKSKHQHLNQKAIRQINMKKSFLLNIPIHLIIGRKHFHEIFNLNSISDENKNVNMIHVYNSSDDNDTLKHLKRTQFVSFDYEKYCNKTDNTNIEYECEEYKFLPNSKRRANKSNDQST